MSRSDDDFDEPFAYLDSLILAGHWADNTFVHRGRGELTIDFVRHIPEPRDRMLVARTIVAPWVGMDLRDQLDEAWRRYPEWPMSEER